MRISNPAATAAWGVGSVNGVVLPGKAFGNGSDDGNEGKEGDEGDEGDAGK